MMMMMVMMMMVINMMLVVVVMMMVVVDDDDGGSDAGSTARQPDPIPSWRLRSDGTEPGRRRSASGHRSTHRHSARGCPSQPSAPSGTRDGDHWCDSAPDQGSPACPDHGQR